MDLYSRALNACFTVILCDHIPQVPDEHIPCIREDTLGTGQQNISSYKSGEGIPSMIFSRPESHRTCMETLQVKG